MKGLSREEKTVDILLPESSDCWSSFGNEYGTDDGSICAHSCLSCARRFKTVNLLVLTGGGSWKAILFSAIPY